MGDPGAILVRVAKIVCLAVVEIINFQQGSSKDLMDMIDVDDLEAETGSTKFATITVQILNLLPYKTFESEGEDLEDESGLTDFTWVWPKGYIQIKHLAKSDSPISQWLYAIKVSGRFFYPLAAGVYVPPKENDMVWRIQNSSLLRVLNAAWEDLDPDTDNIVDNVKKLPEVFGPGLPYQLDNTPQLYCANFTDPEPEEFKANDKINCRICNKVVQLKVMRKHVAKHVLQARCNKDDTKDVEKVCFTYCIIHSLTLFHK